MSNRSARRSPRFEQRGAALHRQFRLFPRRDDARPKAGLGLHPGEKGGSVRGAAARLRGDRVEAAHGAPGELVRAGDERGNGAVHGALGKAAGRREPLAEPDDAAEAVHHAKRAAIGRRGDQQAAIVGSEVERGVGGRRRRPSRRMPGRGACASRSAAAGCRAEDKVACAASSGMRRFCSPPSRPGGARPV